MATEIRPAQRSVPNIVLDPSLNHSPSQTDSSARPSTPNTPVVLLAKPRQQTHPSMTVHDSASSSLLPRPLSAPTSLVSSPSTSSAPGLPLLATSGPVSPSPASSANAGGSQQEIDVDPQIVEALKSSKDRLYVLKLGETMENLINQGTLYAKVDLQPASSYQRLLVHRCATFYRLTQESSHSSIAVTVTPDSRIPSKRIADLVPPEESVLPAFQIMRRADRSKGTSRTTSVDGNLTDEGNESGRSQGSGSRKKKKHMTIEEREAAYHEARSRIFMGFEEKDAASSGAMSSAASTVSYTGGSTGMSSSVDGDGASTAPTESEYSSPIGRALGSAKDSRYSSTSTTGSYSGSNGRGKQPNTGNGSANSNLRSSAPPFSSPNVSPPIGTVHYIPMHDPNMNLHGQSLPPSQQQQQPHPPQQPGSGAPPAAGFAPYAPPTMYPYYVPYFYPYPYPPPPLATHPPTVHPSQPNQPPQDGQTENQNQSLPSPQHAHPQGLMQGQQSQNQQQSGPVPPGYPPHLVPAPPPPGFPGGYMWLPTPGYVPVPATANMQGSGPQGQQQSQPPQPLQNNSAAMNMQPHQNLPNISRPASQASHQNFRSQGQPMQNQNQPPSSYGPFQGPPNVFQGPGQQPPTQAPGPMSNPAGRAPAPPANVMHNNTSAPGFTAPPGSHPQQPGHMYGPGSVPGSTAYGQHGPIGGTRSTGSGQMFNPQAPQQGGGPWNSTAGAVGPGANTNLGGPVNGVIGGAPGPKRNMARGPWGSYSYGPGIGGPPGSSTQSGPITSATSPRSAPNPLGAIGSGPVPVGLANSILRPPEELNIRVMPRITLESHSTGSSNGSNGSLRKRNAAHAGTAVPGAKADETSSVASSSSSSSKRTYTSNASSQPPQHHPLPDRPDWVMNTRMTPGPNSLAHRGRGVPSTGSSSSSITRPSQVGSGSTLGSSSNLSSLATQSTSSNSSSASISTDAMASEFPPLGGTDPRSATVSSGAGSSSTPVGQSGQSQSSRSRTPGTGAWNGNSLPPAVSGISGLPPRPNFANAGEVQPVNTANVARLEEADKKFERPPPKTGASLYDPRKSRSGSKDRLENSAGGAKGIIQGVAALSITVPGTQVGHSGSRDDEQNQPKTPAAKASDGAMTNNENTPAVTIPETSSPASESSGAATAGTGSLGNGQ